MYAADASQAKSDTKSVVARMDTLRTIQPMEKWQDRVRSLMKDKGVTQESLKSVLGVSTRGAVGHYLSGRREPSIDQFKKLAAFFGVTLEWVLSGRGPKTVADLSREQHQLALGEQEWRREEEFWVAVEAIKEVDDNDQSLMKERFGMSYEDLIQATYGDEESRDFAKNGDDEPSTQALPGIADWMFRAVGLEPVKVGPESLASRDKKPGRRPNSELEFFGHMDAWDSNTPLNEDEVELPLFREVELAAGAGLTQVVENHGCKLRFAKSTLSRAGVEPELAACAFVKGNSMSPVMPDGTCVGVNTADKTIRDGEIYALDHGGMLRVKYLYRRPGGGIRIVSQNGQEHPTEEYSVEEMEAEQIRIIGRVFWWSVLR